MNDLIVRDKIFAEPNKLIEQKNNSNKNEFSQLVEKAIKDVDNLEKQADSSVEKLVRGEIGVHDSMIAMQKADISLNLFLKIRNKALEAYKEMIRMPM